MSEFEDWVGRELRRAVAAAEAPTPRAGRARYQRQPARPGLAPARLVLGLAAFLLVASGSVAAVRAAGGRESTSWGSAVRHVVERCNEEARRPAADHGIGECVGALVQQHGDSAGQPLESSAPVPVVVPPRVADSPQEAQGHHGQGQERRVPEARDRDGQSQADERAGAQETPRQAPPLRVEPMSPERAEDAAAGKREDKPEKQESRDVEGREPASRGGRPK